MPDKNIDSNNSNDNIHPIKAKAKQYDFDVELMRVTEAVDGEARTLFYAKRDVSYQPDTHSAGCRYIKEGDIAIVQVISKQLIITDRSRRPGELANADITIEPDGNYVIDAPVGVKLKSPYGTINLTSEGIKIETPHAIIDLSAEGNILINGENIALETKDGQ